MISAKKTCSHTEVGGQILFSQIAKKLLTISAFWFIIYLYDFLNIITLPDHGKYRKLRGSSALYAKPKT